MRCEKLCQPCPGYDRPRKFLDEGPSLHKRFSPTPPHRPPGPHGQSASSPVPASPPVINQPATGLAQPDIRSNQGGAADEPVGHGRGNSPDEAEAAVTGDQLGGTLAMPMLATMATARRSRTSMPPSSTSILLSTTPKGRTAADSSRTCQ